VTNDYFDVVIVGAGLSGIGSACHLVRECPGKSYAILESRETMGGTWDLFRYPGIRSDSDMHTLGYSFKPWKAEKAIADGPAILDYIHETAAENRVDKHIRYGHKVVSASWSTRDAMWTLGVELAATGETLSIRCNVLHVCAGYYRYEHCHLPEFRGYDDFDGVIVDPQHWPENLDYEGKRIVVIGSGATAMTIVPEVSKKAASVMMLQRSPTYVISRPDKDIIANVLRKVLPDKAAYAITRFKNVAFQQWLYSQSMRTPEKVRDKLIGWVRDALGPDYDVDTHFAPRYNPWEQRLCLIPNGDLFDAINSGKAEVVTDTIDTFAATGIRLESGRQLDADIIVTATGLDLVVLGSVDFSVDCKPIDFSETFLYKGIMCSGVPNMLTTFGYINASWTLRADIIAEFLCRLVNHMDEVRARYFVPRLRESERDMPQKPWIEGFSSGYIQRVLHKLPKQGDHDPWINPQNYKKDKKMYREAEVEDGVLTFAGGVDHG
jgi:cation diffusion facilitator CzcD-associated flavoprotein CzcO